MVSCLGERRQLMPIRSRMVRKTVECQNKGTLAGFEVVEGEAVCLDHPS